MPYPLLLQEDNLILSIYRIFSKNLQFSKIEPESIAEALIKNILDCILVLFDKKLVLDQAEECVTDVTKLMLRT